MENIIIKYIENKATKEEKKLLLKWLNESNSNLQKYHEISNIWILSKEEDVISTQEALDKLQRAIEEDNAQYNINTVRKAKPLYNYLRIVAILLVLITSTSLAYHFGCQKGLNVEKDALVMNQVIMGAGSKGEFILPDQSKVWLNEGSKLTYPEKFEQNIRKISLEGEAYFEVVKNEESPFIVETGDHKIRVLGTSFDARCHPMQEKSQIVLLSGKVSIKNQNGEEFVLNPNQKYTYNKLDKRSSITDVRADNYILWTQNKLIFENEKLSTILSKLKYWYSFDMECKEDVPTNIRLSLTLRRESKEDIFRLIELIAPVKANFVPSANKVIVSKRK